MRVCVYVFVFGLSTHQRLQFFIFLQYCPPLLRTSPPPLFLQTLRLCPLSSKAPQHLAAGLCPSAGPPHPTVCKAPQYAHIFHSSWIFTITLYYTPYISGFGESFLTSFNEVRLRPFVLVWDAVLYCNNYWFWMSYMEPSGIYLVSGIYFFDGKQSDFHTC